MWYGQKNYQDKIGSCNYTIAQVGCFLTAFSNKILARRGLRRPPDTLNQIFKNYNVYINGCDLYWNALHKINPSWVVVKTGTGIPGGPGVNPNHTIVCLKADNSFGTHFCNVYRVVGNTVYIIDSWDGQIKKSSAYGPVISWAQIEYI